MPLLFLDLSSHAREYTTKFYSHPKLNYCIFSVATEGDNHASGYSFPQLPTTPTNTVSTSNFIWVFVLVGATLSTAVIGSVVYLRWWNIRCFVHRYLSLRRVRKLKKDGEALTKSEVQYDVFVSYSDIDRSWVLDHLIPSMEADGDVSLCFHERDFQVNRYFLSSNSSNSYYNI